MGKKSSSFHMGDEFNGFGEVRYLKGTQMGVHSPVSQENVRLSLNLENYLLKVLGSMPLILNPSSINPVLLSILGTMASVNRVVITKDETTGKYSFKFITANNMELTDGSYPFDFKITSNEVPVVIGLQDQWVAMGEPTGAKWMFFSNGSILKNSWLYKEGKTYYMDSAGYMVTGWRLVSGDKYYFKTKIVNHKETAGYMSIHWQKINGIWYYFHSNGKMVKSDWAQNESKTYWYYLQNDGTMAVSQIVKWKGKLYYLKDDGAMAVNEEITDPETGIEYQADSSGVLTEISNDITALDSNGYNMIANLERDLTTIEYKNGEIISIKTTTTDVGYGHDYIQNPLSTIPEKMTAKEAFDLLVEDAQEYEAAVASIDAKLTQNQFNSLVGLRYNVGSLGGINGLIEYLENGKYERSRLRSIIISYYDKIIKANPQNEKYRTGWYNRTDQMLNIFFDGNYGRMPINAVNGTVKR